MAHGEPTETRTKEGTVAWRWIGPDERGRDLDIIAVEIQGEKDAPPVLLVIHVIPSHQIGAPS
jgi:hypothetical protein